MRIEHLVFSWWCYFRKLWKCFDMGPSWRKEIPGRKAPRVLPASQVPFISVYFSSTTNRIASYFPYFCCLNALLYNVPRNLALHHQTLNAMKPGAKQFLPWSWCFSDLIQWHKKKKKSDWHSHVGFSIGMSSIFYWNGSYSESLVIGQGKCITLVARLLNPWIDTHALLLA